LGWWEESDLWRIPTGAPKGNGEVSDNPHLVQKGDGIKTRSQAYIRILGERGEVGVTPPEKTKKNTNRHGCRKAKFGRTEAWGRKTSLIARGGKKGGGEKVGKLYFSVLWKKK